ncbi:MAG: Rrf2 family transcriptional regulator [Chlamydiota bacterium]
MAKMIRISEAAALAMHVMVLMAAESRKPLSTGRAAARLKASGAHLSKVLQRLAKAGLVNSIRGPRGGFILSKSPGKITLLDVYETIEGRHCASGCLFDAPGCGAPRCILGGLLKKVNAQLVGYLSGTKLSALADLYAGDNGDEKKHHTN